MRYRRRLQLDGKVVYWVYEALKDADQVAITHCASIAEVQGMLGKVIRGVRVGVVMSVLTPESVRDSETEGVGEKAETMLGLSKMSADRSLRHCDMRDDFNVLTVSSQQ